MKFWATATADLPKSLAAALRITNLTHDFVGTGPNRRGRWQGWNAELGSLDDMPLQSVELTVVERPLGAVKYKPYSFECSVTAWYPEAKRIERVTFAALLPLSLSWRGISGYFPDQNLRFGEAET